MPRCTTCDAEDEHLGAEIEGLCLDCALQELGAPASE